MEVVERWFEEPLNIFNGFYPTSYEHFGDRARDIEGCDPLILHLPSHLTMSD